MGRATLTSAERLPTSRVYDVLVPATRLTEALAEATVRSLREHLGRPEAIRIVAACSPGPEEAEKTGLAGAGPQAVDVEPVWKTALEHLAAHPERDLLVVAPGILAAPLLDLRLQWSAYAAERVAAVSPLCDLDPITSLARHGLLGLTAQEIDVRIAGGGESALVDAPYPLPECSYLRVDLIRRFLGSECPANLHELVRRLRQEGLLIGLAPHVFVGSLGGIPRQTPWQDGPGVSVFLAETPLHRVAHQAGTNQQVAAAPSVRCRARPRILHVSHSLGGGLERWVELFAADSPDLENFVLRSIGERGRFGSQLWLTAGANLWNPLKTWQLTPAIESSVVTHLGYQQALREIVTTLGIDGIIVSSLIGHSLDALRSPVPTVMVLHDYYPFCPALHIFFDGICSECGECLLDECLRNNPLNELFEYRSPREWIVLREAFLDALTSGGARAVAPSHSVIRHFQQLAPETMQWNVPVIPHGSDLRDAWRAPAIPDPQEPLKIVVLGRITPIKGEQLLTEVIERSRHTARFWLLGCGDQGRRLADRHVEVLERYDRDRLPEILAEASPDVGLLLSVVPETFSYTLDELFAACIPPIAVRVGSFNDRIEEGVNGFLCDPDAASVVARLEQLSADRDRLAQVREELRRREVRSVENMVADYREVLGIPDHSPRAYFTGTPFRASESETSSWRQDGSPLGFSEFLHQFERGTLHHIRQTRRLGRWQRAVVQLSATAGFRTARLLMRWLAH